MSQQKTDLSVIICAYTEERWPDLLAAVDSMRQQTVQPREVILAIDHNPILCARARNEFPDTIVVENSQQRGLSGARNSGLAVAQGELIAFMDEDAVAAPDWLARLTAGYDDRRVIGVGGAIEPMWPSQRAGSPGQRPGWFPAEFDWVVGCTYRGMPDAPAPVRNLIGCNMSFRREVFEMVGGFRNGIGRVGKRPVGCEETELCIRLKQHQPDAILLFEPHARVYHRVPESRAQWRYFRQRCYAEGLSKSLVSRSVGAKDGLSNERTYTFRTLPNAALRCLAETCLQRDLSHLARAGAITSGVAFTLAGYLTGMLSERLTAERLTPA